MWASENVLSIDVLQAQLDAHKNAEVTTYVHTPGQLLFPPDIQDKPQDS